METVVFVCQHGSAKSLIAAEYFTQIAAQRGINLKGVSAGLEPYAEVPAPVVAGLAGNGIDVSGFTPQLATANTFATAACRRILSATPAHSSALRTVLSVGHHIATN